MRRARLPGPRWLLRLRKRLVWLLVAIVAVPGLLDVAIGLAHPMVDGRQTCRMVQVVDGDTLRLWCRDTGLESARLTGFDAPELFSPQCFAETLAAHQAKWALRWVIWRADGLQMTREGQDRYDRVLMGLSDARGALATRMIAAGHARQYGGGQRGGWCGG
jgi:micrococcal nuclease